VSVGSSSEVTAERYLTTHLLTSIVKGVKITRLIDRDDCSPEEIARHKANGVRVLSRRHLEAYMFDDEIIRKLCESSNKHEKAQVILGEKANAVLQSVHKGAPEDDIKRASGEIYNSIRKHLNATQGGSNAQAFMRDTLAPLVTEETGVYALLKADIFDS
jgi:hypothetical protein